MRRAMLAVAVAALFLLPVQAAWAVGGSLTARFNPDTENFHGRVRSSNDECSAGRSVKIFLITSGGRELQGRTHADEAGGWRLHLMDAHGSYVAVASRYEAMHATCDRLTSDAVDVM